MIRRVCNVADATAALEYFNAFHDGVISELTLRSHARFEARGVHSISGRLDLDIRFAHYNYREGEPPADQLVRATFRGVRDLVTDIPHHQGEWSIDRVEITAAVRPAGGGEETRLAGRIVHHRLRDGAWAALEGVRFTFDEAELEELFG